MREAISFGPFRLFPTERLVEKDGVPVPIGGRSLDILICLAERAGEVVSNRDLVARVWADIHVDDGNLRFQVAALRKALGDGARFVANVQRRGYSLVAPVSRVAVTEDVRATITALTSQSHTLPQRTPNVIGRDETVKKLIEEILCRRFVTVVGPGGIGKTTVAVAVGHEMLSRFDGAVYFFDLSSFSDGRLVPDAIASTLGFWLQQDNSLPGLFALLKDRRMLLILDSCERIVDAIASLAEGIVEEAPQIHVIATSRESLRADGEYVHRLFPLKCPPQDVVQDLEETLAYPAAELFFERAVASGVDSAPSNFDTASITAICAKLDGIPLAIELAASQVAAYGVQGVASLLDTRFGLSLHGRRTALPRHQTLSATLDWSYDLLPEFEKVVLRRLAIFVGPFTLDAARAVIAGDGIDEEQVVEAIADLVDKSMLTSAIGAGTGFYRLLDMTHAYMLGKDIDAGVARSLARRHASFYSRYLDQVALMSIPAEDAGASLRHCLGNVRAALEWCFSPDGDRATGIDLVAVAAQYFLEMSLLTECQHWVELAITASANAPTSARRELALWYAMGISLMFTKNTEDVPIAFSKGLKIAEDLNDPQSQLRLMSALHIFKTRVSDFIGALELSERAITVAKKLGDPPSITMAEWMAATANHLIGNQPEACVQSESAMTRSLPPEWGSIGRLGYDRRIIALIVHARALWLVGRPEKAIEVATYAIKEAEELDSPWTLCVSLVYSATVFTWSGEWTRAEETIERLIVTSERHSLKPYRAVGLGLKGDLTIRLGRPVTGVRLLRNSLDSANRIQFLATVFMGSLAEGLMMTGHSDEAMTTIEAAIEQLGEAPQTSFAYPELLRIKSQVQRSLNQPATVVEAWLLQSLEQGRKQSSPGWELRAAMNLAELWSEKGRRADALALLRPLYGRFNEGFETPDLKAARFLLEKLGSPRRRTRATH